MRDLLVVIIVIVVHIAYGLTKLAAEFLYVFAGILGTFHPNKGLLLLFAYGQHGIEDGIVEFHIVDVLNKIYALYESFNIKFKHFLGCFRSVHYLYFMPHYCIY